jgi:O-antigen/teichoic acid export membrane protein
MMGRSVVRDLLVTLGSRWVQFLIGLVGSVISARMLGPSDFGRFGVITAAVMILGTLADVGLTYTAAKSIAQYSATDTARSRRVAGIYFRLRILTGTAGGLLGILLSGPIAALLGPRELTPLLQLASCTLFSLGLSSYPGTVFIGLERFDRLGIANIANALITVAGILALFLTGQLNLLNLVAWNVALPILSTIPAWLLLPRDWLPWRLTRLRSGTADFSLIGELLRFTRWIAIANLGTIIAVQGDLLLLGRLAAPADVGIYSVALALALRLDSLNQSLLLVLLPRASKLRNADEIRGYKRQVWRGSLLLGVGLGLVALLSQPLILLLYGESYAPSAGLFLALMAVVLFDLITSSLFLVAFPLNRPRTLAAADWLRVLILGAVGWSLIPLLGGFGAVLARGASRLVGTAYALWALRSSASSVDVEETSGAQNTAH